MSITSFMRIETGFNQDHTVNSEKRQMDLHYDSEGLIVLENNDFAEKAFEIMQKPLERYNERNKKNRRQKSMEDILNASKNCREEILVSIGSIETTGQGTPGRESAKAALEQFYKEFKRDYPNFTVIAAAIHGDEKGAMHMHIDCMLHGRNERQDFGLDYGLVPKWAYRDVGIEERKRNEYDRIGSKKRKMMGLKLQLMQELQLKMQAIGRSHGLDIEFNDKSVDIKHDKQVSVNQFKLLSQYTTKSNKALQEKLLNGYGIEAKKEHGKEYFQIERNAMRRLGEDFIKCNNGATINAKKVFKLLDCMENARENISQISETMEKIKCDIEYAKQKAASEKEMDLTGRDYSKEELKEIIREQNELINEKENTITDILAHAEKITECIDKSNEIEKDIANAMIPDDITREFDKDYISAGESLESAFSGIFDDMEDQKTGGSEETLDGIDIEDDMELER